MRIYGGVTEVLVESGGGEAGAAVHGMKLGIRLELRGVQYPPWSWLAFPPTSHWVSIAPLAPLPSLYSHIHSELPPSGFGCMKIGKRPKFTNAIDTICSQQTLTLLPSLSQVDLFPVIPFCNTALIQSLIKSEAVLPLISWAMDHTIDFIRFNLLKAGTWQLYYWDVPRILMELYK